MKKQDKNKSRSLSAIDNVVQELRFGRGSKTRLVEFVLFAALLPLLGHLIFSEDPLGINSGFPWVIAGPVLFAARYGSIWGFLCSILASAVFIVMPTNAYADELSSLMSLCVGMVVMSVIVGDASLQWRRKSTQSSAENQYLRHRLKQFSTDYHILKVSHGQLEEYLAGQRLSLREALQQLKPVLAGNSEGMVAGKELMAIFAQFCSVQVAGLYVMKDEKCIDPKPVAIHGEMDELQSIDPMMRVAIETHELVSVKLDSLAKDDFQPSALAIVPIVDFNDHLHGLLVIQDMHFMAFQQENLNILSLLGGYIGNLLTRLRGQSHSKTAWFLSELDAALRFSTQHGVQSSLLCLQLDDSEASVSVARFLSQNIRGLDSSWLPITRSDNSAVAILLPLLSDEQCDSYIQRASKLVEKTYGFPLTEILVKSGAMQLQSGDTRKSCMDFVKEYADLDMAAFELQETAASNADEPYERAA